MTGFKGKTILITGASRGIGRAIAIRMGAEGANVIIVAKSTAPTPERPDTVFTVRDEVVSLGGNAIAIPCDLRDEETLAASIREAASSFGGIDAVINNASALFIRGTADTPVKRYDLIQDINARGTFVTVQACLPWLLRSPTPQIITMSPPINMKSRYMGTSPAYVLSKFGMTILTMAFAAEFRDKIAINTLWPATPIATDAIRVNFPDLYESSRQPRIVADAVHALLGGLPDGTPSGEFLTDEDILRRAGISDFSRYNTNPDIPPAKDIFLD